jgi:hypothetical protein
MNTYQILMLRSLTVFPIFTNESRTDVPEGGVEGPEILG